MPLSSCVQNRADSSVLQCPVMQQLEDTSPVLEMAHLYPTHTGVMYWGDEGEQTDLSIPVPADVHAHTAFF